MWNKTIIMESLILSTPVALRIRIFVVGEMRMEKREVKLCKS